MSDEPRAQDAARRALDAARAGGEAARARGSAYALALSHLRAAHALLALSAPADALADLDAASALAAGLELDAEREAQRLVRMASMSLPPATAEDDGDVGVLIAWIEIGRAAALTRLGRWDEAGAAVSRARPLTRGWGRRQLRSSLDAAVDELARSRSRARIASTADDAERALAAVDRVIADRAASAAERLEARYERAALLLDRGLAEESAREALTVLRDCGDGDRLASATRQVLGAALVDLGRGDEAISPLRSAYDGFLALGDSAAVATAAPGLAWLLAEQDRAAEAVDVLERAVGPAREAGDAGAEADVLASLGAARDATGRFRGAVVAFEEAAQAARRAGDPVREADARHGEAVVRATRFPDDPDESVEALTLLDAARVAYDEAGLRDREAGCLHEAAALLARLGSCDAAIARYESALAAYDSLPVEQRDTGTWPDEVADCRASIALLRSGAPLPAGAFASGGHRMSHSRVEST